MKKQLNNIVTAVSVMALLGAVSCNKEKAVETAGSTIRFGVSTVYENGPATKTEYSGKDQNNNNISSTSTAERIDWLPTDQIRILCYHDTPVDSSDDQVEYADYQIELSGNGTDQTHSADLSPIGNGLQWGEGVHDFIALYPSPAQLSEEHAQLTSLDEDAVVSTIPATQTATLSGHVFKPDMNYAYMYAVTSGVEKGSSVQLDFKPLVTTLEFTLLTRAGDAITSNLTSVKLSSTQSNAYLTGNFCAYIDKVEGFQSLDPDNNVIDGGNEITITLPDGGVQLSTTEAYTVTFLTLPMDQTALTLTLNFADDTKRTLELKNNGNWITVPACRKTYIWKVDAPLTVDTYVFTVTNPSDLVYSGGTSTTGSVVSYKYSHGSDIPANRSNIAWNVEGYYPTEADALAGTNKYAAISSTYMTAFTPSSTTGSYAGETVNISYGAGSGTSTTVDLSSEITAKLTCNTGAYVQRGSSGSYWNLANPTTGSTSSIAETANTYIVNAPGYYCFPLVMGNGIKNDSKNTVAYQQTNFKNYKGTALSSATSPLLNEQGGIPSAAYIVWEEADMVALEDKTNWTLPSGCITNSSMTIDAETKTVYWLNFQITDAIKQGCIILAVTDGTNVMWSWTVWVTDYVPKNYSTYSASSDLADVECTYDASKNKVTFMPRNLGWVEGGSTTETHYEQMSVFVRLNQTGTTNYVVMEVTKPEGSVVTGDSAGHNPYYQWGRKDALMPSNGTGNTLLSPLYGKTTTFQNTNAKQALEETIKNPDRHYGYGSSPYDWCSTYDNGWWCAGNTATSADKVTVKTIYDPSPAGYTIPRCNAFLGFRLGTSGTSPNVNGAFAKGYYFWNGYRASRSASTDGMKTIFFPASGQRYDVSGALREVTSDGYYWSAVPSDSNRGKNLHFYSTYEVGPKNGSYRSSGLAVRPSQEQ